MMHSHHQPQLANVTHSTLNYINRMPHAAAYDPAAMCDPYAAMYGGVGNTAAPLTGPVYGPSTTSPYQQFVDPTNGGSEPHAVTELQLKQRQMALQAQYYQTQLAYQQFMAQQQQQQQMAAAAAMMYEQQQQQQQLQHSQYYGAGMTSPYAAQHAGPTSHAMNDVLSAPAEPCRCMYCEAANAHAYEGHQAEAHEPASAVSADHVGVDAASEQRVPPMQSRSQPQEDAPAQANTAATVERHHQAKAAPQTPQTPQRREQHVEVTPKRTGRNGGAGSVNTPSSGSKRGQHSASKQGGKGHHQQQQQQYQQSPGRARDASAPKATHAFVIEGHFKRAFRVQSTFAAAMGAAVVFEGDRGVDLGRVVEMRDAGEHTDKLPRAMRLATPEEVREWQSLEIDGHAAADICATVVEEIGLPITIVDAVFQFDRNKLTFLYEAPERVDFRLLLQQMYNRFRCRIWMELVQPPASAPAAN